MLNYVLKPIVYEQFHKKYARKQNMKVCSVCLRPVVLLTSLGERGCSGLGSQAMGRGPNGRLAQGATHDQGRYPGSQATRRGGTIDSEGNLQSTTLDFWHTSPRPSRHFHDIYSSASSSLSLSRGICSTIQCIIFHCCYSCIKWDTLELFVALKHLSLSSYTPSINTSSFRLLRTTSRRCLCFAFAANAFDLFIGMYMFCVYLSFSASNLFIGISLMYLILYLSKF